MLFRSVLPGGTVVVSVGANNGSDSPILLTGTAQSLTGALPGTVFFDSTATGSVPINLTGTTASGQTSYTGGGTGGGTVNCQNITGSNTTSTWSATLTVNSTVAPSVPSLTNGGMISGTGIFSLSLSVCGITDNEAGVLTSTGTVTAGGAVTALIN